MFRLVDSDSAAARKRQGREFSPTLFAHLRNVDVLRLELLQGRRDIVAHQVKLVPIVVVGIMKGGFEWRHGEDQPSVTGIHRGQFQNLAEKSTVSFWILGVNDNVRTIDQGYDSNFHRTMRVAPCALLLR
jgi:hypothetical protein